MGPCENLEQVLKANERIKHPMILWTGIRIPDYSTSFNVEPSNNDYPGEVLDLYAIALRRKNL